MDTAHMSCYVQGCIRPTKARVDEKNFCDFHLDGALCVKRNYERVVITARGELESNLRSLNETDRE